MSKNTVKGIEFKGSLLCSGGGWFTAQNVKERSFKKNFCFDHSWSEPQILSQPGQSSPPDSLMRLSGLRDTLMYGDHQQ